MIIGVDCLGGDFAPFEIIKGAVKAAQEYDVEVALIGRRDSIHLIAGKALNRPNIHIVDAPDHIEPTESPTRAVRSKPNSSVVVGVKMVKSGDIQAFISAGSTGAVLCASVLFLGIIEGVERPAIACFLDHIPATPALLIDAGANVDCRPQLLAQFAQIGTVYSRHILCIDEPLVGLLSNGSEETKGNQLARESFALLKQLPNINFFGNVEGHDIARRNVDVIVTDGFTGNVVLKTIEGLNDSFLTSARQLGHMFSSAYHLRGHDLLRDLRLGSWAQKMDYTEYGGACLLGVKGNIIIAHGRSQAKAIKSAVRLAMETAGRNIVDKIREGNLEQANRT